MNSENSVLLRSIIISSIILGGLFIGIFFLEDNLVNYVGRHGGNVATGLKLLSLWLVVSATVRSILSLEKKIPGWKLLLGGVALAVLSVLLCTFFLSLYPQYSKVAGIENPFKSAGASIMVFSALGFITSLMAVINARVRNRHLGNLLELLVLIAAAGLFIYFVTR